MPVHRTSANRQVARASSFGRNVARPAARKADKGPLVFKMAAYFGAICVIGWVVITYGNTPDEAGGITPQVESSPTPAPTVASTVAPPSYLDDGDPYIDDGDQVVSGYGSRTAEYWSSGPNPDIPPSQDPLTRDHY